MKIALPSRNNNIDDHFGHCEYFTVFTVDSQNKEITDSETVESPVGCGCKSNIASILAEKGVKVMLAGNMGDGVSFPSSVFIVMTLCPVASIAPVS